MLQRLKEKGTKIHTYVDGLCASAGTFILMMGDDINLYKNSMVMIHKPIRKVRRKRNRFSKICGTSRHC